MPTPRNSSASYVAGSVRSPDGTTFRQSRARPPDKHFAHWPTDSSRPNRRGRREVGDQVLWAIAEIIHEADIEDDRYDAPEAPGLDVVLRGLFLIGDDEHTLSVSDAVFDGLHEYFRQRTLIGREPS